MRPMYDATAPSGPVSMSGKEAQTLPSHDSTPAADSRIVPNTFFTGSSTEAQ